MLLLHASWYGFKGQAQYCGNISIPEDQKPEDLYLLKDSAAFLPVAKQSSNPHCYRNIALHICLSVYKH